MRRVCLLEKESTYSQATDTGTFIGFFNLFKTAGTPPDVTLQTFSSNITAAHKALPSLSVSKESSPTQPVKLATPPEAPKNLWEKSPVKTHHERLPSGRVQTESYQPDAK